MYLPVLRSGPRNDFGRSIIEMSIIIVVKHTGIKEFLLPNRDQDLHSKAKVEIIQESKLPSEVRRLVRGLRKSSGQRFFLNSRRIDIGKRSGGESKPLFVKDPPQTTHQYEISNNDS